MTNMRYDLPGEVLWLRPGKQCQHFPCWLLFVLKKNKQERRFRLAVTTFPVFVKRSPLISYKPPEYIRCKIFVHIFVFVCVYHVWFFDHFSSIPYWDARRTSSSLMITRFHIRMKLIVLTAKQMVPQYGQWDMRWLRKFENHWYWLTETLTSSNFLRVINLTPPRIFFISQDIVRLAWWEGFLLRREFVSCVVYVEIATGTIGQKWNVYIINN